MKRKSNSRAAARVVDVANDDQVIEKALNNPDLLQVFAWAIEDHNLKQAEVRIALRRRRLRVLEQQASCDVETLADALIDLASDLEDVAKRPAAECLPLYERAVALWEAAPEARQLAGDGFTRALESMDACLSKCDPPRALEISRKRLALAERRAQEHAKGTESELDAALLACQEHCEQLGVAEDAAVYGQRLDERRAAKQAEKAQPAAKAPELSPHEEQKRLHVAAFGMALAGVRTFASRTDSHAPELSLWANTDLAAHVSKALQLDFESGLNAAVIKVASGSTLLFGPAAVRVAREFGVSVVRLMTSNSCGPALPVADDCEGEPAWHAFLRTEGYRIWDIGEGR